MLRRCNVTRTTRHASNTMNKISNTITRAFIQGKAKQSGNDATDGSILTLHFNRIARKIAGEIEVSNGNYGVPSATTKARLNALAKNAGFTLRFFVKKGEAGVRNWSTHKEVKWDGTWRALSDFVKLTA